MTFDGGNGTPVEREKGLRRANKMREVKENPTKRAIWRVGITERQTYDI